MSNNFGIRIPRDASPFERALAWWAYDDDDRLMTLLLSDEAARRQLLALPAGYVARVDVVWFWCDEEEPMDQGQSTRAIDLAVEVARSLEARDAARAAWAEIIDDNDSAPSSTAASST